MANRVKILFLAFFSMACLSFKPGDPIEKLLKQLAKLTANYPQEKIHLHTDKPYYAIGEDVWFKAYVVTAEKNGPSSVSKVLYVDLIDDQNIIKKKLTLPIENGLAKGNISLLDTLASGNYRLRSYTNYMRNFADDFFFEKKIKVGNIIDTAQQQEKNPKQKISLKFFPEGGELIAGIRSKVGVKALVNNGAGINLSGYIINRNNDKVAEFSTVHAGMGVFALTPLKAERYRAIITLADGKNMAFDLPNIQESGYNLAVSQNAEKINLKIAASGDLIAQGKQIIIIGQTNGVIYATLTGKIDEHAMKASLPKSDFPTGIAQFTLFTAEYKPIAERLAFINNSDSLKISILPKHQESATKKKSSYGIAVTDANSNPIDGNFSVSVTNADQVQINEDDETSIFSSLLLSSDLKGFIEQPNYYFNLANTNREEYLDHLMLTQGWRRFVWQDVIEEKEPNITYRPEQSLEISGNITSLYNKALPNAKVKLFSITPGLNLNLDTISDAKGNFMFDRLDLPDSASFLIQSKMGKNNKYIRIRLQDRPFAKEEAFSGSAINMAPYLQGTKAMYEELDKYHMLSKGIMLKPVVIKGKTPLKIIKPVPNSQNASGIADYVVTKKTLDKEISMMSAFFKIPGLYTKNGKIYRFGRGSITSRKPMLLIVDGLYIDQDDDPTFLNSIRPQDLEGIEVLLRNYNLVTYGSEGVAGVIYITSKTGAIRGEAATNIAKVTNAGFTPIREFYAPDYDDPKTDQQMRDLRSTVYWNPNINTSVYGKADLSYFNTSLPGKYRIVIEGMDSYGLMGRKVYTYTVN